MENIQYLADGVMKMMGEISINFAVDMARKLHKNGIPMGLAIYKAARYYNTDKHLVAVGVGRMGAILSKSKHIATPQLKKQSYWWDNL
jgi:hypothetical protein